MLVHVHIYLCNVWETYQLMCMCMFLDISESRHVLSGQWRSKTCRVWNRFLQKLWRYLLTYGTLQRYCSGILRNFLRAELSKALNKANSRLNTTWNTTQCKPSSFFLFSLHLLLTNLPYTFRYTHFSSACAFQDSCTRGAAGSAL